MAATIKIPAEFIAKDKFSKVIKSMTRTTGNFSTKGIYAIQRFDHKISKTFKKMGNLSRMALGLGIGALFSAGIQANLAYESSLKSVSAITGAVGSDMVKLEKNILSVAKNTHQKAAIIADAFKLVGSAKPELLGNIGALTKTTEAVIKLAEASKMDLETSAMSLTNVMNQFNLGPDQSTRTINALAAGAKMGAAEIPQLSESILQFGTGAKAFNVTMEESIGLVETFASKGIKGAEAGTKLRNILSKMSAIDALPKSAITELQKFGVNTDLVSNKTLPLAKRLTELSKISANSTALVRVFGLENKEAGGILLNNINVFNKMTKGVTGTNEATRQAGINSSTLSKRLEKLKNSFFNSTTATTEGNKSLMLISDSMNWAANNMDKIISIAVPLIATLAVLKIATWAMVTAQSALAVANMAALWPILAIVAAITAVIAIFYNWDNITKWFSNQWENFTNKIGEIWGNMVKWFKSFDFKGFFIDIGQSILKFLLTPIESVFGLLSKLPGKVGSLAKMGLDKIGNITGEVNVKNEAPAKPLDSPELRHAQSNEATRQAMVKGQIGINISDPGRVVESTTSNGNVPIPVKITSTQGVN